MATISEKSKITLSVVLALIGGSAWLTTEHNLNQANADAIKSSNEAVRRLEDQQIQYGKDVQTILVKITALESSLKKSCR